MAKLNRIVDIKTLMQTTGIKKNEFNAGLFLTPHLFSLPRIIAVSAADDLVGLGFSTDSSAYKAALTYFAQKPSATNFFIGRVGVSEADYVIKNKDILTGNYGFIVKLHDDTGNTISQEVSYTAEATTDNTGNVVQLTEKSIYDGLAKAIKDSDIKVITSTSSLSGLKIRPSSVDSKFTIKVVGNLIQQDIKAGESFVDALVACNNENSYWYGLAIDSVEENDILSVAEWVEANEKLFGIKGDAKVTDGSITNDIASKLKAKTFGRSFVIATLTNMEFPQLAIMSQCFAYYPGQETWANKKLYTITSDNLLESEYQSAFNKNATTYELFAGQLPLTQTGKLADGEWIDVLRFSDWLKTEIQADVANVFAKTPKIPYTDGGIQMITNAMLPALRLGVDRGGIAPTELDEDGNVIESYRIKAPLATSVSPNNKAQRILRDIYVTVRLAGAIHRVEMQLTFTYENI